MEVIIYQVDVFTSKAFSGNPAAVVPDASGLDEIDMKNIAREMNLSETVFVIPINKDEFKTRFFTPKCEIDLCGHATIAAFYTLAYKGYIDNIYNGVVRKYQHTRVGKLPVDIYFRKGKIERVMMVQGTPRFIDYIENIDLLCSALNITVEDIGLKGVTTKPEIISIGVPDIIVPLKSKDILDNLLVDFNKIKEISQELNVIGIHVFTVDDLKDMKNIYCRNFAPLVGINEEAATGTSNGSLIYYLERNNLLKGKSMVSHQGHSLGRPSEIICEIGKNNSDYMIKVGGKCSLVMEGIISQK